MVINWLKAKKQKSKELRQQKLASECTAPETERAMPGMDCAVPAAKVQLMNVDTESITPPDTRFTEEYQQFLAGQQAAGTQGGEANCKRRGSCYENLRDRGSPRLSPRQVP